ncbi:MAG TPA: hypothetical protein VGH23_11105 [Rhizomicrobium sp.]|jgi:hypothetical protein
MRSGTVIASLLLAASILTGCQHVMEIVLFNNTGVPITINAELEDAIVPGQSGEFYYPRYTMNWTLLISAGACDYLYQAPRSLDHWPWPIDYKTEPTVQLERDFSIWAVPPDTSGVTDVSALKAQQTNGFPLHPVSRTCH